MFSRRDRIEELIGSVKSDVACLCDLLYKIIIYIRQLGDISIVKLCTKSNDLQQEKLDSRIMRVLIVLILFCIIISIGITDKCMLINNVVLGLLGFVISYQIYYKFCSKTTGGYSWGMLKTKYIHVHHWIYCLIILMLVGCNNSFIVGLCFGGIAHGIQFYDWNKVFI